MTDAGRRQVRRRKYLSLGVGELVAAAVLAAVLPRLVGPGDRWALWFALIPLLVVLVQAGSYWLLARGWVGRGSMPASLATVYRAFRWADVVLLIGGLAGLLLSLPDGGRSMVVVLAIWVFGVVEYLNYFVVRLAYPVGGWARSVRQWRTPQMIKDLRTPRSAGSIPDAEQPGS
jgi:hypothetical protein